MQHGRASLCIMYVYIAYQILATYSHIPDALFLEPHIMFRSTEYLFFQNMPPKALNIATYATANRW